MIQKEKNYNFKGRFLGKLRKDGVFVTHRSKKHFFRKFKGFGISTFILMNLYKHDCHKIVFVYSKEDGTKEIYESTPSTFLKSGKVWEDNGDYQRIVPINKMDKR